MLGTSRAGVNEGQTIRLEIQFYDMGNSPVDPSVFPSLTIVDPNGVTALTVNSSTGVTRQDIGLYYYDYIIPFPGPLGSWQDIWSTSVNGTPLNNSFSFKVTPPSQPVTAVPGQEIDDQLSQQAVINVMLLLKLLRARLGSDGVRRKRDSFGRYVVDSTGNYVTEQCNVFTTDELYIFLKASLAEFNSIPHFTSFTFNDTNFVNTFQHELTEGAWLLAFAKQGLLEKGREFQITDDGLSYQPPMISEYIKGYLSEYLSKYQERIKFIKCNMKPEPRGLGTVYSFASGGAAPAFLRLRHLRARQII